jgi:hypothetical protein
MAGDWIHIVANTPSGALYATSPEWRDLDERLA